MRKLLLLPGDGIGPEIFSAMAPIFAWLKDQEALALQIDQRAAGYSAYASDGDTISAETLHAAAEADATLFGSESTEEYMHLPKTERPEPCLLRLRHAVGCYANLRPVKMHPALEVNSSLRPEVVRDVDMVIVRELLGGLYFGRPSGIETVENGRRRAVDTMVYHEDEIERILVVAFELARTRRKRVCSVDKANVLATSSLWRDLAATVAARYPDVETSNMYVDNAAMQLVRQPGQFDVIVTENTFGDILSDCAAMVGGSIGMMASASLGAPRSGGRSSGLYEPISGSAPDIAGRNFANPVGTVLSLALALRHSLEAPSQAEAIEAAVDAALTGGARTRDIGGTLGTREMVQAIGDELPKARAG